jgi:signal transduction histidine kinase
LRAASTQISTVVPDDFRQRVRGRFNDVHARLGALDESLRQIAHSIRSTTAVARPVADAVEGELVALEGATGIEVDLNVTGNLSTLSDSQKIVLFRVVQEALSNVRKHSGARRVSVALRSRRTFVEVTVTDDGCGFAPQQLDTDRLGLAGISERVRLLGGAVQIETSPGAGTTVRATLPQWRPSTPAAATIYAASS